jgi:hypothetical protein
MLASALSFIAILALAALNGWLGRSGRLGRDPGDPRVRIALDLIDFDEREGQAANDGRAHVALGASEHDFAVAIRLGDGWVTRRLGPASLRRVSRAGPRLTLRTHDFTLPVIDLAFADGEQAARWETRFADLIPVPTHAPRNAIATELARESHP